MRVLFISHFFPPTHTAGAENYTLGIARRLAASGHEVYVLCAGRWTEGKQYWNGQTHEVYEDVSVTRLHLSWTKAPDPNRFLYANPIVADYLEKFLKTIQPDVLHITSCYTLSASVIETAKRAGLPVVLTLVDFWFLCPSLHLLRSTGELCNGQTTPWECLHCMLAGAKVFRWPARILPEPLLRRGLTLASELLWINRRRGLQGMALDMTERKTYLAEQLRQVDVILAPSLFLADMHRAVMGELEIRVQPYGHDLAWTKALLARTGDAQFRFAFMGQITSIKGVHLLVEAFLRLSDLPGLQLDIWGDLAQDPAYTEQLRRLADEDERVTLRGRFLRAQLGQVLVDTDVVVVPSTWYENNPLTLQEAFAAGRPVIATNLGGMSEFVQHEVNGLLFERDNIDDFARQLRRVATEPDLVERFRSAIPPVRSLDQEVVDLMQIYTSLSKSTLEAA